MQTKSENQPTEFRHAACPGTVRLRPGLGAVAYEVVRVPLDLPAAATGRFDAVGFGLNTTDILAVVDHYPQPGSKGPIRQLDTLPGGQAATAMTACSRLGWRARYVGRFGDDPYGTSGLETLRAAGVDVAACKTIPGATNALSLILVDRRSGQRTVLWSRHPSLKMSVGDVSAAEVCSGRVLLVDCHETEAATAAARYARASGIPTVVDVERVRPGIEALLEQVDVIITAQDFPTQLTGVDGLGAALHAIRRAFRPALVCTTLGEAGSLALTAEGEIRTPGFRVDAVDTTGAGDVFRGGFIAGWLLGGGEAQVEDVLRYANATAALKCRALGARSGIPTREEVADLLM